MPQGLDARPTLSGRLAALHILGSATRCTAFSPRAVPLHAPCHFTSRASHAAPRPALICRHGLSHVAAVCGAVYAELYMRSCICGASAIPHSALPPHADPHDDSPSPIAHTAAPRTPTDWMARARGVTQGDCMERLLWEVDLSLHDAARFDGETQ